MSKRGWLLFLALGVIWGIPYLLIRVAVEDLSPAVVVFGRLSLGALVLLPLAIRQGQAGVIRTHWRGILLFAVVEMCIPFGALGIAEQRISSSLAGLLIAAVPMVNAVATYRLGMDTSWNSRRVGGLFIGLAGVALLVGFDIHADNWWSVAICGFAVIGYACGPIMITKFMNDVPSSGVISWSQTVAAAIYLPFVAVQLSTGHWNTGTVHVKAWAAVVGLGLVCTAAAFVLLFALVEEAGPSRTTLITYMNPAVAVILGISILDEPFTRGIALGFPLVLIGSFLATRKPVTPQPVTT